MAVPLLQTKLYIPPPRPDWVSRPRLLERLNAGLSRKLTLVSAPAGFGKTTLLSEWVHSRQATLPQQVAWLTLDKRDDDPARFWTYFIAALQTIRPGVGETALIGLQAPQPQLPSIEILLTSLINDITTAPDLLVLVLDDYHTVKTPAIHAGLSFLLEHLPAAGGALGGLHLVIASRADPPLPLPRLRIRGDLIELRNADLRFTPGEVAAFFGGTLDLDLSAQDIAALQARTEGWVASLQVVALSMREQTAERVSSFIQAFTGSHRYILDYLIEEVLERQPESVQAFLLRTAVLDRLTGPLCDAVALIGEEQPSAPRPQMHLTAQDVDHRQIGPGGSQATLERLERANLFIVPLDEERRWYRYHHLFADLLRARLNQALPDLVPELHRRASAWYEGNGFTEEALGHALDAEAYDRAARLVGDHFWPMVRRGEVRTILRWLQALPADLVRGRPGLSLCYAQVLGINLRLEDLEPYLRDAEGALRDTPDAGMLGWVDALRASLTRIRGDTPGAIELSHRALERIPEENLDLRGIVTLDLGLAYLMCDDLSAAGKVIAAAIELNQAVGNALFALSALGVLAELQGSQGRLHQAAETHRQALEVAAEQTDRGQPLSPAVGTSYAGLAALAREWNDLDTASRHALQAIELGERTGLADPSLWGYVALARTRQAQGDVAAAFDAMDKAASVIRRSKIPQWTAGLDACRARLWLAQKQSAAGTPGSEDDRAQQAIARWVQSSTLGKDWRQQGATLFLPGHTRDFEHLTLARAFIARDDLDQALALLSWLHQPAQAAGRMQSVIEILVLRALALSRIPAGPSGLPRREGRAQSSGDEALASLGRALVLAEPQGYVRVFVDEGRPMAELLSQLLVTKRQGHTRGRRPFLGVSQTYIDKLLAAFGSQESKPEAGRVDRTPETPGSVILIEPLSKREIEVLRLLSAGLSNREIAEELYLSVNTVKVHAKNIYGKLDVHGRMQAVQRARELHLL